MVGHAEIAIRESAARAYYLHIGVMVADIVTDLLKTSEGDEVTQGIDEDCLSRESQSCGYSNHVLLGYPAVNESVWELVSERLDQAIANVTHE